MIKILGGMMELIWEGLRTLVSSPDHTLLVLMLLGSVFSKSMTYLSYFFIFKMLIDNLAGKTTELNVNVMATIGITISLGISLYLFYENKQLKRNQQ